MDYENVKKSDLAITDEKSLRLLSIYKASKILGIRYESVLKMVMLGKIKCIRIGKRMKIPYINLIRFIDDQTEMLKPNMINVSSVEETSKKIDELFAKYASVGYN